MSTVQNTLKLNDQISKPLQNIVKALHMTLNIMEQLNSASAKDMKISHTIGLARAEISNANKSINNMTNSIQETNNQAKQTQNIFNGWQGTLTGIYSGVQLIKQGFSLGNQATNALDSLTSINARLNLINDGSQTLSELQQKIYRAAQNSRGEYSAMASSVSKLGILAKDAFSSNDEAIFFLKQMNKQFKIGGASIMEQQSAMYQLTQAMAAGRLQGDEFRSIMENAPLLAQAIAKQMGVSQGKLKELGADGKITASVIKNAMINSAEETNKRFAQLPMTFGDMATLIKNRVVTAFDPIVQKASQLGNWFNTPIVQGYFNVFVNGLVMATEKAILLFNAFGQIMAFLAGNQTVQIALMIIISIINSIINTVIFMSNIITQFGGAVLPILFSVAMGFLVYKSYVLASAAATTIHTAVIKTWTAITKAGSIAQWALNTAMRANPIGLIISLVVGLVTIMLTLISTMKPVREAFANAFKFIMNVVSGVFGYMVDYVQFWANSWINAINLVLKGLGKLAETSNNLFGTNFQTDFQIEKIDMSKFKQAGKDFLNSVGDAGKNAINNFDVNKLKQSLGFNVMSDKQQNLIDEQDKLFGQGNSQIGSIKDNVKIDEEDIKMLRDIAERDAINKITALSPNIQVTFGDVRETADVNAVTGRIKEILQEQIALSAEGAYV